MNVEKLERTLHEELVHGRLVLPADKICVLNLAGTPIVLQFDGRSPASISRVPPSQTIRADALIHVSGEDLVNLLETPTLAPRLMMSGKLKVTNLPVVLAFARAIKSVLPDLQSL